MLQRADLRVVTTEGQCELEMFICYEYEYRSYAAAGWAALGDPGRPIFARLDGTWDGQAAKAAQMARSHPAWQI